MFDDAILDSCIESKDEILAEPTFTQKLPNLTAPICSRRPVGLIQAFGAQTNQGVLRRYNEDRLSIVVQLPQRGEDWPLCSYFGLFDGHNGHLCADFLRDNLHHFITNEASFPSDPKQAITDAFAKADAHFLDTVEKHTKGALLDRSGACAVIALFVGDVCYIANVGEAKALLSASSG